MKDQAEIFRLCDLIRETCLIVELKACKSIIDDHTAQLLGYLRASRIEHGLLINFGASKWRSKSMFYRLVINIASFVPFCGRKVSFIGK